MLYERTRVLENLNRALFIVTLEGVHRVISSGVLDEAQMATRFRRPLLTLPAIDLAADSTQLEVAHSGAG